MSAQPINVTLSYGGLACTVLTVEALTGLDIPYAGLITFNGVISMSTAVGGVPVCINGPLRDAYTGLDLPAAGTYPLEGQQALAFLRSRHGVGDGSDLGRISSQQVFLSSLVRTIKSDSTLTDFPKLFGIAQAATSNMTLSDSLAPLNTQVSMALTLKDIPLERITFVQYPNTTGQGGVYAGKVAPIKSQATALFDKIRNDEAFILDSGTGRGSVADPNAPAPQTRVPSTDVAADPSTNPAAPLDPSAPAGPEVLDGVLGQTAAEYTCSKVNR
jgi:LCP family protein required for cell wall assembly